MNPWKPRSRPSWNPAISPWCWTNAETTPFTRLTGPATLVLPVRPGEPAWSRLASNQSCETCWKSQTRSFSISKTHIRVMNVLGHLELDYVALMVIPSWAILVFHKDCKYNKHYLQVASEYRFRIITGIFLRSSCVRKMDMTATD